MDYHFLNCSLSCELFCPPQAMPLVIYCAARNRFLADFNNGIVFSGGKLFEFDNLTRGLLLRRAYAH